MTTSTDAAPTGPRAAGVHWDLSPLVADADEAAPAAGRRPRAGPRVRDALPRRARDHGRAGLAEALEELSAIDNELSRVSSYVTPARVG